MKSSSTTLALIRERIADTVGTSEQRDAEEQRALLADLLAAAYTALRHRALAG